MRTLTTTEDLAQFCQMAQGKPYVTIDTEFLRERTYYSKLCLIQMALPGGSSENAVLIDPLVGEMSLEPLYDLFRDTSIVKVFHAARQDLEIFFIEAGVFPDPLFDTQGVPRQVEVEHDPAELQVATFPRRFGGEQHWQVVVKLSDGVVFLRANSKPN